MDKRSAVQSTLRDRLIDGRYPQGEKLTEKELLQEFNISRPILREILVNLENQGLLVRIQNRGVVVRRIDADCLFDIMDIREVLEGLAARLSAQNSRPEDWVELEEKFSNYAEELIKEKDYDRFLTIVLELREKMLNTSQNKDLTNLIKMLFAKITIVQRRVVILPGRVEESINQHREVIKAIMAGDGVTAERLKRENIRSAKECLMKYKKWIL